jgi:hypothetical protein
MTMNDDKRPMTDEEMALALENTRRLELGLYQLSWWGPYPGGRARNAAMRMLAKARELLCPAARDEGGSGEEVAMPRLERALWDDHEGNQLAEAELAIIDAARSDLADAMRAKDAEIADLRSKLEAIGRRYVGALDNSENSAWELDRLCAEAAAKDAEIADLRSKLAKDERGTGPLRREIAELKQKVEQLTQDRNTERAMKTGCQQNLLMISADLNAIGASVKEDELISERAGRTLGEQQAEIELLTKERDDLKQQVEQCRNDGSVLRDLVERLTKERDELRLRLRETAQILISETGANGPMNADAAASLAVSKLNQVENERDEMKSRVAGLENELSMVRKDFARACKERDEVKAEAQATITSEPLSGDERLARKTLDEAGRQMERAAAEERGRQDEYTVEPLSAEEIAKLVKHYFETDMDYTAFNLARDVAAAQRAKAKTQAACTVEPLAEAEIDNIVLKWRYADIGQKEVLRKVAEAQRAKVRSVELPTVEEIAREMNRSVPSSWHIDWHDYAVAVLALFRERMVVAKPVELPTAEEIARVMAREVLIRDGINVDNFKPEYRWWFDWNDDAEAVLDMFRERMGGAK